MNSDKSKCFPSLNSTEKKKPCSSPKCSQSVFPQVTAINSFFCISFWNLFLLCSGSSGVGTVMYPDSRFRTEGLISLAGLVNPPRGLSALKRGLETKAKLPPQGSAFSVCVWEVQTQTHWAALMGPSSPRALMVVSIPEATQTGHLCPPHSSLSLLLVLSSGRRFMNLLHAAVCCRGGFPGNPACWDCQIAACPIADSISLVRRLT